MPNGYRRGGSYTRGGKTFQRRGAKIKHPVGLYAFAGVSVFAMWQIGAPVLSNPVALGAVLAVGVGIVVWKNRKRLRPIMQPIARGIEQRAAGRRKRRNTRPEIFARTAPRGQWRKDGMYLDAQLRPHHAGGKFATIKEWEAGLPGSHKPTRAQRWTTVTQTGQRAMGGGCRTHGTNPAPGCLTCTMES